MVSKGIVQRVQLLVKTYWLAARVEYHQQVTRLRTTLQVFQKPSERRLNQDRLQLASRHRRITRQVQLRHSAQVKAFKMHKQRLAEVQAHSERSLSSVKMGPLQKAIPQPVVKVTKKCTDLKDRYTSLKATSKIQPVAGLFFHT